jgi:hypothetical protein
MCGESGYVQCAMSYIYVSVAAQQLQLRLKPVLRGDLSDIHVIKWSRCYRFTQILWGKSLFKFFPQYLKTFTITIDKVWR